MWKMLLYLQIRSFDSDAEAETATAAVQLLGNMINGRHWTMIYGFVKAEKRIFLQQKIGNVTIFALFFVIYCLDLPPQDYKMIK